MLEASGRVSEHIFAMQIELTWVLAYPTRMEQNVINLLNNPINDTPGGGSIMPKINQRAQHAVITVTGSGIGIDALLLPQIFEVFVQRTVHSVGRRVA